MLVHMKGSFTLLGKIEYKSELERYKFIVPYGDKNNVIVEIIPKEKQIETFMDAEISNELLETLNKGVIDGKDLPKSIKGEISRITSGLSWATRKVMNLVKYALNQTNISESLFSVKDTFWSIDKVTWQRFPMILVAAGTVIDFAYLNENTSKILQKYIENDFEPFFALSHLHKAKNESNPRSKWINATIAAELAIKEFLIRKEPSLEPLLLEVPSPPIHKLYGSILEFYANERSPKLKELAKGAETRNRLLHRPKEQKIDLQEAMNYVQDVEIAIFHLITLLYPSDPFAKKFYGKTIFVMKNSGSST